MDAEISLSYYSLQAPFVEIQNYLSGVFHLKSPRRLTPKRGVRPDYDSLWLEALEADVQILYAQVRHDYIWLKYAKNIRCILIYVRVGSFIGYIRYLPKA